MSSVDRIIYPELYWIALDRQPPLEGFGGSFIAGGLPLPLLSGLHWGEYLPDRCGSHQMPDVAERIGCERVGSHNQRESFTLVFHTPCGEGDLFRR